MNQSLLPCPIDKKTVFSNDVDSSLWAEVTLGTTWKHLWKDDAERSVAPPWAVDSDVRQGIKHKLLLDRIKEERKRLEDEVTNLEEWLTASVFEIWGACDNARLEGTHTHSV